MLAKNADLGPPNPLFRAHWSWTVNPSSSAHRQRGGPRDNRCPQTFVVQATTSTLVIRIAMLRRRS